MYTDEDLDSAVAAGVLAAESAASLRAFVAHSRRTLLADEENLRFVTSFNDVFVVIASALLLAAVAWIAARGAPWLGCAAVAGVAWGLSEFFTRRRHMALPSIFLLLAFVGAVFGGVLLAGMPTRVPEEEAGAFLLAGAGIVSAAAAWLHWRRFRVPITVAAGIAALVVVAVTVLMDLLPQAEDWLEGVMLLSGLLVFALAMAWDMSDPGRRTRRSDVAFWLHLLSAPLIVHPVFQLVGVGAGRTGLADALVVLLLYLLMGMVALVVDRRALLVSALFYVLYAFSELLKRFGVVGLNMALTGLLIGSALLLLSAFWHASRVRVVRCLPGIWQRKLPPLQP